MVIEGKYPVILTLVPHRQAEQIVCRLKTLNKNGCCKDILLLYSFLMMTACVTIATAGLTGSRPDVGLLFPYIK